ncbi:MAG TPA: hypothetical protein VFG20_01770 [Planctomycetaceae bacterium]|nr:hypothetical protein [Planctomycetaceae bacterium]
MRPLSRVLIVSLFLVSVVPIRAEDQSTPERDAHRLKMRQVAESFQISVKEEAVAAKLAAEPLFRYTDATRRLHESALWLWGTKGRPVAVMAIEFYPKQPKNTPWLFEIVSLSAERIRAKHTTHLDWLAEKPGVAFRDLPDAGVPADRPTLRLAQMRQLMRRFTANETAVIEGRIELRPMANALHRYDDATLKVIDGAIFAFANGTNPEVFVLLEAQSVAGGPPTWKYSLAQMTGGSVAVSVDGNEVWSCKEADPPAVRPSYVNGWLRLE